MGATNPANAAPGTIRGDLALSMPDNLVHGSDSPESAEREIALWFPACGRSRFFDQARRNREFWDSHSDDYHERNARFIEHGLAWGLWQIPEAELQVLGDVAGKEVLELGCGAAEWSRALARAGARPVGLDNFGARLAHARAALAEEGLDFPLVHASAEATPFDDASFDIVMADWGAPTFADPHLFRTRGRPASSAAAASSPSAAARRSPGLRSTGVRHVHRPPPPRPFGMHR